MQLRQHTPSLSELISCLRRDLVLSFFRVKLSEIDNYSAVSVSKKLA